MGGITLPTASTPGYGRIVIGGRAFVGCDCLRAWLPVVEHLGLALGLIRESLDCIQLTGAATKSAGVHAAGGAADLVQRSDPWIALYRNAGAAAWRRDADPDDGNVWPADEEHTHLVLIGCPHNGPARYQVEAYRAGYDGLGYLGRAHRDPHPKPATIRTWSQGIAWAQSELERLEDMAAPSAQEIARTVWGADIIPAPQDANSAAAKANPTWGPGSYLRETFRLVERVAAQDRARDEKLSAQVGSLAAVIKALETSPGLTFDQALRAAEEGARVALAERITDAQVVLEVTPPPA
jgi:hypothetical protein